MVSTKKNKSLYIDTEALSSLALVQAGLIAPVVGLMNKKTSQDVNQNKTYKGMPFPFSFILAPKGKKNHETLMSIQPNETIDLISDKHKVGELIVEETFEIDPNERVNNIYGTTDLSHPGVRNTLARLGTIAVSGEYKVEYPLIQNNLKQVKEIIKKTSARHVAGIVLAANPFNRAHEKLIRQTLSPVSYTHLTLPTKRIV